MGGETHLQIHETHSLADFACAPLFGITIVRVYRISIKFPIAVQGEVVTSLQALLGRWRCHITPLLAHPRNQKQASLLWVSYTVHVSSHKTAPRVFVFCPAPRLLSRESHLQEHCISVVWTRKAKVGPYVGR